MIEHGAMAAWLAAPTRRVGVSLKMYMDHTRTLQWLAEVAALEVPSGVELFVIPDFLSLYPAAAVLAGSAIKLGLRTCSGRIRGLIPARFPRRCWWLPAVATLKSATPSDGPCSRKAIP